MASFLEELKKSNPLQEGINKTGAGFQLPQIQPQITQGQVQVPTLNPGGVEFDFSGLPNISDTGLSEEAFGRLSPTAQSAIIPDTDIVPGQPTIQGIDGVVPTAPEGLRKAIDPSTGSAILADPTTAAGFNAQESELQRSDLAAQQSFLSSPEGREFSNRQIRAAQAPTTFDLESAAREQRAAEGFGAARGPDSMDRADGALTMERATRLTGGDRTEAGRMIELEKMGRDPLTGQLPKPEDEPSQRRSATEEKIATIKSANPSISDEDASAIASGSVKVVQNPLTGETQLLNITTGESRKVDTAQSTGVSFDVTAPDETLFSRAGQFTGAVEAAKRKAQGITGQAGLDVATDESLAAAQDFETAQNELVRAFRESDRYSATEANQLKKELNISLSPFEDPKSAEAKLRSIDKSLERRYENEIATFQDTSFPPADRQDARLRAKAIATFRANLGVPEETPSGEAGNVPSGVDPSDWEFMSEEQRNLFR